MNIRIKLLFIFAIFLLIYSCDSVIPTELDDNVMQNPMDINVIRSPEEAYLIATNSAQFFVSNIHTRSSNDMKSKIDKSPVVIRNKKTRTNDYTQNSDTLLYIFNIENDNGFVVISANPQTEAVLAVTESGHYNETDAEQIKGFETLMNNAVRYVSSSRIANEPILPVFSDTLILNQVFPKLGEHRWGQTIPEGMFCRNGIAGCTNIAIAEIMSYYEHPSSITLTYEERDVDMIDLDWTDIKRHIVSREDCHNSASGNNSIFRCYATDSAHRNLARLCREIGKNTISFYGHNGTASHESHIYNALSPYEYITSGLINFSDSCTKLPLINDKLVLMVGYDQSTGEGHVFVVDGYKELLIRNMDIIPYCETHEIFNHVNWGWDGIYNGYFSDHLFHPYNAYRYDMTKYPNTFNNADYCFSDSLKYITVYH